MRSYTQWTTSLLIATVFVLTVTGSAAARDTPQKQKAAPTKQTPLAVHSKASGSLIAKVKAPKPVSRMSLAEVERFQTQALMHYTGMWKTWLTVVKPHYRGLEDYPMSPQWRMRNCRGAVAPRWACWNLEARLWTRANLLETRDRIEAVRVNTALRSGRLDTLTTDELYAAADREVRHGGIYGIGWGAASPLLKSLCYEALNRKFGANAGWARFVVNRESGCNPSAQNVTYAACNNWSTCQRATGLSQMIPAVHRWVDYNRVMHDLRYSVDVFFRLSNGGRTTGPWSM